MSSPKWDLVNGVRYQTEIHQNEYPKVTIIRDEDKIRKLEEEFKGAPTLSYPKEFQSFLGALIIDDYWSSK